MHGSIAQIQALANERMFGRNNFGTIVRALWPEKTALHLAQRIGCTERAALYLITGQRKVTARAVAVILNEIIS